MLPKPAGMIIEELNPLTYSLGERPKKSHKNMIQKNYNGQIIHWRPTS